MQYLSWKSGVLSAALLLAAAVTVNASAPCCAAAPSPAPAGNPAEAADAAENGLFAYFERISAALVADDLDAARKAARETAELAAGKEQERAAEFAVAVAEAEGLEAMREAFIPLSREVIKLAAGEEGYYVMNCPMVENGKWLQSHDAVQNPYMGQRMIACGGVEMPTAEIELRACCEERRECCDEIGACCPV